MTVLARRPPPLRTGTPRKRAARGRAARFRGAPGTAAPQTALAMLTPEDAS
jgi:hypothetical protein